MRRLRIQLVESDRIVLDREVEETLLELDQGDVGFISLLLEEGLESLIGDRGWSMGMRTPGEAERAHAAGTRLHRALEQFEKQLTARNAKKEDR